MICEKCGQPELTPQRKAFYEAARAWWRADDGMHEDETYAAFKAAWIALAESERGESGKIPGLYKLGSGE